MPANTAMRARPSSGMIRYEHATLLDARGAYVGVLYTERDAIRYAGAEDPGLPHETSIDCGGHTLMPAFIDLHCHLRDPGYPEKETLETGMRAALAGGYGTLVAMANTKPTIERPEQVEENHRRAKALRLTRLIQAAAAGAGLGDSEATDWAVLAACTPMLTNDGRNIDDDAFMERLLRFARAERVLISTHAEPELTMVERDLALMRKLEREAPGGFCPLHIGHISLAETAARIREAQREGIRVTCEITPHHLIGWGNPYRVNPPLRTEADARALIAAIEDGTANYLATDHAPHTPADKAAGMAGISGIEYAFGIYWQVFHRNGIPLTRLSEMASRFPAERLGLRAGLLEEGYAADLVLVDPDWAGEIRPDEMISRSHNTPFAGYPLRGQILMTTVEGELRYDHGSTVR